MKTSILECREIQQDGAVTEVHLGILVECEETGAQAVHNYQLTADEVSAYMADIASVVAVIEREAEGASACLQAPEVPRAAEVRRDVSALAALLAPPTDEPLPETE